MIRTRQARRGFTLVELLVVVAIIALLLGVLLPALGKAKKIAIVTKCMSNQRAIVTGVAVYSSEYGVIPNGPDDIASDGGYQEANAAGLGFADGQKPHATSQIWATDSRLMSMGLLMGGSGFDPTVMFCPGDDERNHETELPKIKDREPNSYSFCSYLYRQQTQTQRPKLEALGKNDGGVEAKALIMDYNTNVSFYGQTFSRSCHEADKVNLGFVDGSVSTVPNNEGSMVLTSPDTFTGGAIKQRALMFRMADEAYFRGGDYEPINNN